MRNRVFDKKKKWEIAFLTRKNVDFRGFSKNIFGTELWLKGRPSIQFHKDWVPWKSDRLWAKTGIPKVVDGTETVTNDVEHQLSFLDQFVTEFEPK